MEPFYFTRYENLRRFEKNLILKTFQVLIKLDFYTVPLFDINILCDFLNYAWFFSTRQNN
jgi:hypothetical protein